MNILGISAFYHDSAACLVQDGRIVSAAQEERFTRKKHDLSFPRNAIASCLQQGGVTGSDLDLVAFYEKPFLRFERILETYLAYAPAGIRSFLRAMPPWIKQKLWMRELICRELNWDGDVVFPEHHESHAASAFFPSPFQQAAFLTIDGVGEWTTTAYGVGDGDRVDIHKEIHFPHSLGLLYSAFTYHTGFKVNSGEYKVMGLAPFGQPRYKDLILSELMDLKADGSFRLNMRYFDYCAGLTMTNARFSRLFEGPPRIPESQLTERDMDLARSVQEVIEEAVMRMSRHLHEETRQVNLCLAGGVALNCVSNGRVLREGPFERIWIQPAAGDAGGALGAALFAWHQYLGNDRQTDGESDSQLGSYLGPGFDSEFIEDYLQKNEVPYERLKPEDIPKRVADLIAQQKVIGWFQGRMEFGPRALGGRSIIGDARSGNMQNEINQKIKFRESFRPLAPSVLAERASEYFDIDVESPYMLLTAKVRNEHRRPVTGEEKAQSGLDRIKVVRSSVPAVTHVDYSARLQTVNGDDNPLYYDMMASFNDNYGCPVIINTSFNVRGEPIVRTPQEAYRCFMRTDMDCLIMGEFLIDKKDQNPNNTSVEKSQELQGEEPSEVIRLLRGIDCSRGAVRKSGIALGIALAIIGCLLWWRGWSHYPFFMVASAALLVPALLAPLWLRPFHRAWMTLALILNWILTRVLLGVLFYLIISPMAVVGRLIGRDKLQLRSDEATDTCWKPRQVNGRDKNSYERQY